MTKMFVKTAMSQFSDFVTGRDEGFNKIDVAMPTIEDLQTELRTNNEILPFFEIKLSQNVISVCYSTGLSSALNDVFHYMQLNNIASLSPQIPFAISKEMYFAQGWRFAADFVRMANSDLSQIETEIINRKESIVESLKENPNGPMSPRSSPRIWKDGYIEALETAVKIIIAINEGSSLPKVIFRRYL